MMAVESFAPAKINLALHVTGQRDDGYHLLDSLVAFADFGDSVIVKAADHLSLSITGPFANGLSAGEENLVLRAARLLGRETATAQGAEITLVKRLPVASGIGGGSADAAATLRALSTLWSVPLPPERDCVALGADVPVCLASEFSRMTGVGEVIEPLGRCPERAVVLVNPGIAVPTPDVFRGLMRKDNPPLADMPVVDDPAWLNWLALQRNDLEAPAIASEPIIGEVLDELRALSGCQLARMSGSGATCFGLFEGAVGQEVLDTLRTRRPGWWIASTRLLSSGVSVRTPR